VTIFLLGLVLYVLIGLLLEGEFSAVTVATVAGFLVSIGRINSNLLAMNP